jgi:hypothetical protein
MTYLLLLLGSIALLAGFFIVTSYETRGGIRFFSLHRSRLDQAAEHFAFVWNHVDFGSFIRTEVRHFARQIEHGSVHLTLRAVRSVERLLTRLVRYLHSSRPVAETTPRESAREFVKTLSDFKGYLRENPPEVPQL